MGNTYGIDFSATGNASGGSEVLDDYEEGTFTPTFYKGTGTSQPNYSWRYGKYTKIGGIVHVTLSMGLTGETDTYATCFIGGLPVSFNVQTGHFFYVQLHGYAWQSGYGDSGSETRLFLEFNPSINSTKVRMHTGGGKAATTDADIGSGQRFTLAFSYPCFS